MCESFGQKRGAVASCSRGLSAGKRYRTARILFLVFFRVGSFPEGCYIHVSHSIVLWETKWYLRFCFALLLCYFGQYPTPGIHRSRWSPGPKSTFIGLEIIPNVCMVSAVRPTVVGTRSEKIRVITLSLPRCFCVLTIFFHPSGNPNVLILACAESSRVHEGRVFVSRSCSVKFRHEVTASDLR